MSRVAWLPSEAGWSMTPYPFESWTMTEADYLSCDDPRRLLEFLRGKVSDRKLRLFACAVNTYTENDWESTESKKRDFAWADDGGREEFARGLELLTDSLANDHGTIPEQSVKAAMLRDIAGNVFRPTSLCDAVLAWNDDCVPKLAQAIYDGRRFDETGILADAIEEAGCESEEMLRHLRVEERCPKCLGGGDVVVDDSHGYGTGYYMPCAKCKSAGWIRKRGPCVRGCWCIDLILGKE